MSSRLSTNYNKLGDLVYLDSEDLLAIEINAKMLELDECFDMLFIEKDELSEYEFAVCKKAHRRGRKTAIADAGKHLFSQMQTRNGTQACMEYLKQMSGTFQMEVTPDAGSGSGFTFNVMMPENDGS